MSEFDIKLYKYRLKYKKPIFMKGQWQDHRMGLILTYKIEKDSESIVDTNTIDKGLSKYYFTEFAPFLGLHEESIEGILNLKSKILSIAEKIVKKELVDLSVFPSSVRIGLELFQNEILTNHINPEKINEQLIHVAPLVHGSEKEVLEKVEDINNFKSVKSIKLKLGRQKLQDDIDLFNLVDFNLNKSIKIRADINRAWSYEDAILLSKKIIKSRVEYFEEPINDFNKLDDLFLETGMNYALDESIYEGLEINSFKYKYALIIKPNLLESLDLLNEFKYKKNKMIFSSAFESGILISKYLGLVEEFADLNDAQGLDTYSSLDQDVLKNRLLFKDYKISLSEIYQQSNFLNYSVLEEI